MLKINNSQPILTQKYAINTDNNVSAPGELSQSLAGKTNINGVIDDFKQGTTGDCYLLTRLKNLSRKSWGKKAIKESIEPDGMGGAYVTFRGALNPSTFNRQPMKFHVSVEEILNIREKQNTEIDTSKYNFNNQNDIDKYNEEYANLHQFSSGDDGVLAIELAYDKYMKMHGRDMSRGDAVSNTMNNGKRPTDNGQIVKLITGTDAHGFSENSFGTGNIALIDKALTEVKKNLDNYVLEIGFKKNNKYGLIPNHAYEIIDFKTDRCGNPMIILGNPWDSSKQIEMNYYDAITASSDVFIWENPNERTNLFGDFGTLTLENFNDVSAEDLTKMDSLQNVYQERHEQCLREEEEERRLAEIEEKYSIIKEILNIENREERLNNFNKYLQNTEPEIVNPVLKEKYFDVIEQICQAERGIFRRRARRKLMTPLVDYVAEQALKNGISADEVEVFRTTCNKELKRWLFFKKSNFINAFDKLLAGKNT